MSDIKRSLSNLQTLYADNITGEITPQDLRDGFKTVVGSYYTSASSESTINLSANEVYLSINTSASNIVVNLPSASSSDGTGDTFKGKYYVVSNYSPTSANNVITLSADTLINNGSYTFNISANNTNTIISDGYTWYTHYTSGITSQWVTSGNNIVFNDGRVIINSLSASSLVSTNSSNELESLDTDNYPSLTEISYIKGLTSALQTQLLKRYLKPTTELSNTSNTTITPTVGTPYYYRYTVQSDCQIDAYEFNVASFTTSGTVEIGVYTGSDTGTLTLVADSVGSIAVTSTGFKNITLSTPIILTSTQYSYYIAFLERSGGGAFTLLASSSARNSNALFSTGATSASTLPATESTRSSYNIAIYIQPK